MNTTSRRAPCLNQVALDSASNRHVTCDDGRRLDLELYRDYSHEQAVVLRRRAALERRAFVRAALHRAAASCVGGVRDLLRTVFRNPGAQRVQ